MFVILRRNSRINVGFFLKCIFCKMIKFRMFLNIFMNRNIGEIIIYRQVDVFFRELMQDWFVFELLIFLLKMIFLVVVSWFFKYEFMLVKLCVLLSVVIVMVLS